MLNTATTSVNSLTTLIVCGIAVGTHSTDTAVLPLPSLLDVQYVVLWSWQPSLSSFAASGNDGANGMETRLTFSVTAGPSTILQQVAWLFSQHLMLLMDRRPHLLLISSFSRNSLMYYMHAHNNNWITCAVIVIPN